jgi:hypothetical protein
VFDSFKTVNSCTRNSFRSEFKAVENCRKLRFCAVFQLLGSAILQLGKDCHQHQFDWIRSGSEWNQNRSYIANCNSLWFLSLLWFFVRSVFQNVNSFRWFHLNQIRDWGDLYHLHRLASRVKFPGNWSKSSLIDSNGISSLLFSGQSDLVKVWYSSHFLSNLSCWPHLFCWLWLTVPGENIRSCCWFSMSNFQQSLKSGLVSEFRKLIMCSPNSLIGNCARSVNHLITDPSQNAEKSMAKFRMPSECMWAWCLVSKFVLPTCHPPND